MIRLLFTSATLLGTAAIIWIASTFVGTNTLALIVTAVIAVGYFLGTGELIQFRRATAGLKQALEQLTDSAEDPGRWVKQLHPSLQHPTLLRLEGERAMLPAPVFTPYLVGLLVMLGLLGTFVGMVDTLQGAVTALQGSTEIDAIRHGLAAPINGLSVAFGTSVAGVAASAMLGLNSTISRHERGLVSQLLDSAARSTFAEHSASHQRQQTYTAIQQQSQALPKVTEHLQQLAQTLESLGTTLSSTLTDNQKEFHRTTQSSFETLAESVNESLRQNMIESGRQAANEIQPLITQTVAVLSESTQQIQQTLTTVAEQQLTNLNSQVTEVIGQLREELSNGISRDNELLAEREQLMQQLQNLSEKLGSTVDNQQDAMITLVSNSAELLKQVGNDFSTQVSDHVSQVSEATAGFSSSTEDLKALGESLDNAVQLYNESNQTLVGSLNRIEAALDNSTTRSDEQMGYYVAQAREIIDQTLLSQQDLVEEVRGLSPQSIAKAS